MRRLSITLLLAGLFGVVPLAAQAPSGEAQLALARSQFEALNYEEAVATLDPLIAALESQAPRDPVATGLLSTAYELRARSRFQLGSQEGANADFRALLKIAPGYSLSGQVSQRVLRLFEDLRKANVGRMILNLTPPDADLELDGVPVTPAAGEIPMAVGAHTLSGRRVGCRSASQTFTVVAGQTTEVVLTLERVSASLAVVTAPAAVEVIVDGVSRGRTEAGALTPQWVEAVEKLGLAPGSASKPFVLDEIPVGTHTLEFVRDCYIKVERRLSVDKPADFRLDPISLSRAIGSISVDSTQAPGAVVLLNGESRGPAPLQLDDVCEGSYVVELRSSWGRYLERVAIRPGDKLNVRGAVRPAVALLSVTGLPDGYRGTDLRLGLERGFAPSKTMTLFAPAPERVQQVLKGEALSPGWLAFDRRRRPAGSTASSITPAARAEIGSRLAKALDVQGVAELTARPGADQFLLSILAAGSTEPDVVEVRLDSAAALGDILARLDQVPPMHRPSVGLSVADVLDVTGAVVTAVDQDGAAAKAGLVAGDVITAIDGQPVADGSSFGALVAQRKSGDKLSAEVKGKAGGVKGATLTVAMAPRLVAMNDQSVLFNHLVLSLRSRLAAQSGGGVADSIMRLNLAVGLMRLGNWPGALAELSKVQLPAGPGVSTGTVQYLLGLSYEALGQAAEAERAFRAAADTASLLTEDGPAVKELAERKLARGRR